MKLGIEVALASDGPEKISNGAGIACIEIHRSL
jgi:hypothetical protein